MIRVTILQVAALALCLFGAHAQNAATPSTEVSKVFGESSDHGFRVLFSRYGATVKHINLTDHLAEVANEDGSRDEYLLSDILWVNPALPSASYWSWMYLEEWYPDQRVLDADLRTALWEVAEDTTDRIRFELDCGAGLTLEKVFSYEGSRRDLGVEFALRASGEHPKAGSEVLLRLTGLAVRSPRSEYTIGINFAKCVGEVIGTEDGDVFQAAVADGNPLEAAPPVVGLASGGARIKFAGSTNRFFSALLYPDGDAASEGLWTAQMRPYPTLEQADTPAYSLPVCEFGLRMRVPQAGSESRLKFRYYLGPKSERVYADRDEYERFVPIIFHDLEPPCCSIPGTQSIARFLLWALGSLYDFVGNWGIAIMILTIFVRGALVPVNFRMQKSMRAYGAKAAKFKPKLEAIQKQYANDKVQLRQAMMEFQREHKLFPPIGGCLPMFITIPIFIGLFTALRTSYDLRQEPFFGWLDDLSQPDQLFYLGFGDVVPYFNLLPLLMVGLWWWLQSGTPLPTDPQQRQMMKIMRFMPLMFGVMLYNYASGLMVYMITSSLFALVEQRIVKRVLGPMNPEAAAFGAPQI